MNKRELLYEIDKFDEALQNHKYTEELIPVDKYFPYKLDERSLVRSDFESSIYVEDSFLEDSEVYLYLKNKYSKVERKDKITNE